MKIYIPCKKSFDVEVKTNSQFFTNRNMKNKVFFGILNDSGTVKLFLDAIINKDLDDAKAYISKGIANSIDLDEVREVFEKGKIYKCTAKNGFNKDHKGFKTNSVLIMENGVSKVLHLHLVQEPDIYGNWKIFGIDKE